MNTPHQILLLGWILFCALHSILASLGWKKTMQRLMGRHFRLYRLYYTLFAFLTLGLLIWYHTVIESPLLFTPLWWPKILGIGIGIGGLVIMGICIRKYFMHLSGLKSLYLNDEQAANQLQISGIHRYVRHPLYSGTFLAIWGAWLYYPVLSLFIANSVITVYTLLAIEWEEQKLIKEFGDSYIQYRKQVPKLIPNPLSHS